MKREDPRISRTREAVLEAALDMTAQTGFKSLTIEGIARHSGVAKSTIYRHWQHASDILLEGLESEASVHHPTDTGSLRGDLIQILQGLSASLTKERYGQLLPNVVALASTDTRFATTLQEYVENRRQIDRGTFQRAIQRGELAPNADIDQIQELFISPIFYRHLISLEPIDNEWIASHVQTVTTDLDVQIARP
jgi:AcrR family transcriptional regulator